MPKVIHVRMLVPSGSRPPAMKDWLNKLLSPHRREVLDVAEEQDTDSLQRFPDGQLKPFISASDYDSLRDDDRFLYNRRSS